MQNIYFFYKIGLMFPILKTSKPALRMSRFGLRCVMGFRRVRNRLECDNEVVAC